MLAVLSFLTAFLSLLAVLVALYNQRKNGKKVDHITLLVNSRMTEAQATIVKQDTRITALEGALSLESGEALKVGSTVTVSNETPITGEVTEAPA